MGVGGLFLLLTLTEHLYKTDAEYILDNRLTLSWDSLNLSSLPAPGAWLPSLRVDWVPHFFYFIFISLGFKETLTLSDSG